MSLHSAFDRQDYDIMTMNNVRKLKTNAADFEVSFYRQPPGPIPNQAQAPHPMVPRQTLDMLRGEMQAMMEDTSAVIYWEVKDQMAYKLGQTGRRLEGDLRDLDQRVGVLETPVGPKRRISYELIRSEEIKKEIQ